MNSRFLALLLAAVTLAGCAEQSSTDSIPRERIDADIVSSVNGVSPDADGNFSFVTGPGLILAPDENESALRLTLADVVRSVVLQACAAECIDAEVPRGAILAEGGLLSLRNLSLNAGGPDRDSGILFYDGANEGGQFLRWADALHRFQISNDLQSGGNLTASHHVGTMTILQDQTGQLVSVSTAATEGIESTIFARGSARLAFGSATVTLPEAFTALVGDGPLTAQVTLTGDGPALFVAEKSAESIVVRATGNSTSSVTFDWFVQATRKGGEDFEP